MKRRYARHGKTPTACHSKTKTPLFKRTSVKVISFAVAFVIAGAAFLIPSAPMTPNVEAIANKKASALSVGDIKEFSDIIAENCKTEEPAAVLAATEQETTEPVAEEETQPTEPESTEPETEPETTEPQTEANEDSDNYSSVMSYVSDSVVKSDCLLSISNPDPGYNPPCISLLDKDRDLLERLVMGEAGSLGYTGCALIAQAVRDTMLLEGTTSVEQIIKNYGYTASVSITPSSSAVEAVNFIFDNGGSAVQHRILYFYAVSVCDSTWHEQQNFVVQYGNVKFFD